MSLRGEQYESFINQNYRNLTDEDLNEIKEELLSWEEELFPKLLKDEDVSSYITWQWKIKVTDFHQPFYKAKAISKFHKDLENNELGAVKLWDAFSYHYEVEGEIDALIMFYILAYCNFKLSYNDGIIFDPNDFNYEELEQKLSLKEKVIESAGIGVVGSILGIPGIGLLAKWEKHDEIRRQQKIFRGEIYDLKANPAFLVMNVPEIKELRDSMREKIEGL
ncbi:hypothetical protein [Peribacillus phoenicis]|uniref:hypothetical protein n=1 Tax=unclassified Peribacillus TaxID=2675266 RepID=UPI00399F1F8B